MMTSFFKIIHVLRLFVPTLLQESVTFLPTATFHCNIPQHAAQYTLIPPIRLHVKGRWGGGDGAEDMWKHYTSIKEGMVGGEGGEREKESYHTKV